MRNLTKWFFIGVLIAFVALVAFGGYMFASWMAAL